jgi:predicted AlkP superfamily pyrophosphatase or phosphodiesterase
LISGREPVVPRYGEASLADLLPSVLAALGVPGDFARVIDLPDVRRVCILLIDGLGVIQLREHPSDAPFLASLLVPGQELTAGFPSTTATSLSSLGTGVPPGGHGLMGFEMYVPELGRAMNCLRWDPSVHPARFQPLPTMFEHAEAAGVAVIRIGPAAFDGTGLTESSLRGGTYAAADYLGERVAAVGAGIRAGTRSAVYVYYGDVDATGHSAGCESSAWRYQLAHADRLAEQVASALPDDALLLITADHGMVDVPPDARVDVAASPELDAGVHLVTGEPRAAYVHTVAGAEADVLDTWLDRFGELAWVVSRAQAVDEGWFGPAVRPELLRRIGDVIVAAREPVAVVDSRRMSRELLGLIGLHGSMTAAEQLVPLLRYGCRAGTS